MESILLVSETNVGFHSKLTHFTRKSLYNAGFESVGIEAKEEMSPAAWHKKFDKVALYGAERLHIIRLLNPIPLLEAIESYNQPINFTISMLLAALSEQVRRPKRKEALEILAGRPEITKIFVMSIHHRSLRQYCAEEDYLQTKKVVFMDQPLYETKSQFRKIDKDSARWTLKLPAKASVALYFGTYWYSRGPDLLLEVAKNNPDVLFCFVGDTKLASIEIDPKQWTKYSNIRFDDEYVSDTKMFHWMRAADLVVLPYRAFYTHDSSGVFDQAMLAERPVIIPDFPPFSNLHDDFENVSILFKAEDPSNLDLALKMFFRTGIANNFSGFDAYLKQKGHWNVIGNSLKEEL